MTVTAAKEFAALVPGIKAAGYISILDALGLKDASKIATAREELRLLNAELKKTKDEIKVMPVGEVITSATQQLLAELSYAIQAKELEQERLIIAQELNRAKEKFKTTMDALKGRSQAGTITPLDYRTQETTEIEAYNKVIQDQQDRLMDLILVYPQWREELTLAKNDMESLKEKIQNATGAVGTWTQAWNGFTKGLGASENALASIGQAMGNRLGAAIDGLITGTKTLGQAFKEMAIGIIQDIAKIIVKMLILKALDMMFFGGAPVASTAGASYNRGGRVRGFSRGGYLSRFGPDRDSIPAMLTPGEFVIRRSAVDKYGTGLLSMINNMMAPSNLSGMAKSASNYRGNVQGFNTGGEVPGVGGAGRAEGPQPAYIVANERSMQSLLTGGKSAMLEFLRQNRGAFSGNARGGSR